MIRDYCGVLNEESIRKNFVLIYEVIDEAIDYGHAQLMTTEQIRQFIVNEPVLFAEQIQEEKKKKQSWKPSFFKQNAISTTAI